MSTVSSSGLLFRQTAAVQDDTFTVSQLPHYQLLLSIGKSNLLLAVIDSARNKVLALEEYDLDRVYNPREVAGQLALLFGQHPWLGKGAWGSIRCMMQHGPYTLLPASLFSEYEKDAYFNLVSHFDRQAEILLHYTHTGLDLVVVFSLGKEFLGVLNRLNSRAKPTVVHEVSALIEGVLHAQPRSTATKAFILVEPQNATILLLRDNTIQFCNSFYFTTPEDFIYYVLLVLQENQLNPETDPVLVWGELLPDSALFAILQKYIRNVSLGKRPASLTYSYRLEDFFPHRYFPLYSLALCNG